MNKNMFLCICSLLLIVSVGFTEVIHDNNTTIQTSVQVETTAPNNTNPQPFTNATNTATELATSTTNSTNSTTIPVTTQPFTTTENTTKQTEEPEKIIDTQSTTPNVKPDYTIPLNSFFIINPDLPNQNDINLVEWSSSDTSIATVDSGGRVDAIKIGYATITANLRGSKTKYVVSVTDKSESVYDGFSTCIIANNDILEKNIASGSYQNPYYLKVNRASNCVTAYTYDENGKYTVPVRAMICSVGLDGGTVTGDFSIYFKNEWNGLFGDVYGHYVSGFYGNYLFHSVPFYDTAPDTLETEEFNKLGQDASMGCVRMEIADVKWIFENCGVSTPVIVYDDYNVAGPLGKPEAIKITNLNCGWDPTDDNPENPYYSAKPVLYGVSNVTVDKNTTFNALEGVVADDSCGNDITPKIKVSGNVLVNKSGTYKVTYSVEDAMHRVAEKTVNVNVL